MMTKANTYRAAAVLPAIKPWLTSPSREACGHPHFTGEDTEAQWLYNYQY